MITEYILAIIVCVMMNAFFAGSEAALTSISKIRLRHLIEVGNKRAKVINEFIKKEGDFLGTTLVGTNIAVIVSSALSTKLFSTWFGQNAAVLSSLCMTILLLVFGELIPKTVFRQSANTISLSVIVPLKLMFRILYPVIFVVTTVTNVIFLPLKKKRAKEFDKGPLHTVTETDIETALKAGKEKGIAGPDEKTLIQRIFKMGRTRVLEVMVPLSDATLIDIDNPVEALKNVAIQTRFSRFPVYDGSTTNIVGIINIYDMLFANEMKPDLRGYLQQAYFIYQNEPVDEVLSDLRRKKKTIAVILDNNSRPIGIVTIEDLLEEIVGEID